MEDHRLLIAVWTLPVATMVAAVIWIPLALIVLMAFAARLILRLVRSDGREVNLEPRQTARASA